MASVMMVRLGGRMAPSHDADDGAHIMRYENGVMMIRFFGSHEEYDKVDAETV